MGKIKKNFQTENENKCIAWISKDHLILLQNYKGQLIIC